MRNNDAIEMMKERVALSICSAISAQGLTQQDAAKRSDIHRSQMCRIMQGRIDGYSLQTLICVASKLSVDVTINVQVNESA